MTGIKKLIGVTGAFLLIYTAAVSLHQSASESPLTAAAASAQSVSTAAYTARAEDDRIAVYAGNSLLMKTDTRVSDLPKIDRIRLREGIGFDSEEELREFVEDYCS